MSKQLIMLRFYHETFALAPKLWCRHIYFYLFVGEGAIYQHQHVCAPSLTTTILPSYFKKILATNNLVLRLNPILPSIFYTS